MTLLSHGTVRARFEEEGDRTHREREFLALSMAALQTPSHYQGLSERLLELIPDADPTQRRAVLYIASALVGAISRGSTGLPVENEGDGLSMESELQLLFDTARRIVEEAREANAERPEEERRQIPEGLFEDCKASEIIETFEALRDNRPVAGKLLGKPDAYAPLIVDGGVLYTHKTAAMERRVASGIASLLRVEDIVDVDASDTSEAIDYVLSRMPFAIDDEEKRGAQGRLQCLLPGRLGIITGGAGSGKTTMVLMVLRTLLEIPSHNGGIDASDIALAAPTGKAAKRLGESIDEQLNDLGEEFGELEEIEVLRRELDEPKTLHRLLKYSPYMRRFRRNADNPLEAKLVVVDEASMMGLEMVEALVEALADDARLLLVGDSGQLPSVEAGAVFHDLSREDGDRDELARRVVTLHENHRVKAGDEDAARIVDVSKAIRGGDTDAARLVDSGDMSMNTTAADLSTTNSGVHFFDLPTIKSDADSDEVIDEILEAWTKTHFAQLWPTEEQRNADSTYWYRQQPGPFIHDDQGRFGDDVSEKIERIFEAVEACQVLTITRVDRRGSDAINRLVHRRYLDAHGLQYPGYPQFEPGEPVMITRNDYEEGVFNGQQGIILFTIHEGDEQAKKRLVIRDGDGFRAVSFKRLKDKLDHAYALTVHKSQGSEYDHVAVILPERLDDPDEVDDELRIHPLLTREILYTAVTRAKKSASVYGDPRVFDESIATTAGRHCGVRGRVLEGSV